MKAKILLTLSMIAVLTLGGLTLTAGACEDQCLTAYQLASGRCYDYPASSWLRKACLLAASNQYQYCLSQCP